MWRSGAAFLRVPKYQMFRNFYNLLASLNSLLVEWLIRINPGKVNAWPFSAKKVRPTDVGSRFRMAALPIVLGAKEFFRFAM